MCNRWYRTPKFSGGAPFSTSAVVYKLQKVVPVSFLLPSRYHVDTIFLVQKHFCLACHKLLGIGPALQYTHVYSE